MIEFLQAWHWHRHKHGFGVFMYEWIDGQLAGGIKYTSLRYYVQTSQLNLCL